MIRLGVAFALLPLLAACSGSSSSGPDDGGGGPAAQVMCEKFVKDQLKSPASAEFSGQEYAKSKRGWKVTGIVDSDNSFGAKLRADYSCNLKYVGNDEWQALAVDLNPR